jgi:hypothetical protein
MADEDDVAIPVPFYSDFTYREIHAFQHGLYSGFVEGSRRTEYSRGKEKHYWRMGYLIMAVFRCMILVYLVLQLY